MKNSELEKMLLNPELFEINRLKPRSFINSNNRKLDLNGKFEFEFYGNLKNRNENLHLTNFDGFADNITVPSNIELEGYGQIQYVNTQYPWDGVENVKIGEMPTEINYGFAYKKSFTVKNMSEKMILCFEGVESAFNVWINEQYIGYGKDAYTTSEFDITKYLIEGENTIVIDVYKYSATSFLDDQDFWRLSGIFRSLYITYESNLINDFEISYDLDVENKNAVVNIEFEKNEKENVLIEVYDSNKCKMYTTNSTDKTIKFNLSNLKLWSAEVPYLYTFVFKCEQQNIEKKIGFRKIEIVDNQMLINGKKLIFKGINRHEFDTNLGRAIGVTEIIKDLNLLKKANFNAIRTSHYPNNIAFYDLCDEYGFYVIDEANLETHGTWSVCDVVEKNKDLILPNDNDLYYPAIKDRVSNMIERDKNCTSVIIWSLGNECFGGKKLYELHKFVEARDSKRLCHYEGISWDRRFPLTSHIESQMYTHSSVIQKSIDDNEFAKPIILCEFSHAMGNSNGNFHEYIDLEKNNPQYHGGFIWEYMDQAINVDGKLKFGGDFGEFPNDYNFICDGITNANREETDELLYIKNLFSPIEVEDCGDSFVITNKNNFKDYHNLKININKSSEESMYSIESFTIDLAVDESYIIKKDYCGYINIILEEDGNEIKSFGYQKDINNIEKQIETTNLRFVDGNLNFGLHSDQFSVMFSKVHGNLSQIKYEETLIFKDTTNTITPNFWRAPTNNDIGAEKHLEFSKLHSISYFYKSEIKYYEYKNNQLIVDVEFSSPSFTEYKSTIQYIVDNNGNIKVKLTTKGLNEVFNFGIKAELHDDFTSYIYLGNGPYNSYSDRCEGMSKAYFEEEIDNSGEYLFPQESKNKTNVDYLKINGLSGTFKIVTDKAEFSLKCNTDNDYTYKTHNWELSNDTRFLRLNKNQTGVAGDDSWGSWVKSEYKCFVENDFMFEIKR